MNSTYSRAFESAVHELADLTDGNVRSLYGTITPEQYSDFKKQWLFDAISGKRYGQAFCDYFGISNATPLYHFRDTAICERWIEDNYLVGSR